MWNCFDAEHSLQVRIAVSKREMPAGVANFLIHFWQTTHYERLAKKTLTQFGVLSFYKEDSSLLSEEDWTIEDVSYFGEGNGKNEYHFCLTLNPCQRKWIDVYGMWEVIFWNSRIIGAYRRTE